MAVWTMEMNDRGVLGGDLDRRVVLIRGMSMMAGGLCLGSRECQLIRYLPYLVHTRHLQLISFASCTGVV